MIEHPTCPSCDAFEWESLGTRTFSRADHEDLSAYDRKRYSVLFELWQPDRSTCTITFLACRRCGFVLYSPRPSPDDLDSKYRHLVAISGSDPDPMLDAESESNRALSLASAVEPLLRLQKPAEILDYGGGDGHLLGPLHAAGHSCSVVDWNENPVAGVQWLGRTLGDLDQARRFDLIVASHILEHLAEPKPVLEHLRRQLQANAALFVEVPLEIWGCLPPITEPVTHVNFFIPESLSRLLIHAGFRVERCWITIVPYGHSRLRVIRAIGRPANSTAEAAETAASGLADVLHCLRPSLARRLQLRLSDPASWTNALRYRLHRLLGRTR